MVSTVQNVIDHEMKTYKARLGGDAGVDKAMRDLADAEEFQAARRRLEFKEVVQQTRVKKKVQQELKEAKSRLAKVRKVNREESMVMEEREAEKPYSAEMFGQGKKKGGSAQFQKKRQEALNRLRAFGHLSIEQENDWELFAKEWDARMAELHCAAWGGLFAEIIANVVSQLEGGNANALSDFMHKESRRVLGSVPMVRIPGRGH